MKVSRDAAEILRGPVTANGRFSVMLDPLFADESDNGAGCAGISVKIRHDVSLVSQATVSLATAQKCDGPEGRELLCLDVQLQIAENIKLSGLVVDEAQAPRPGAIVALLKAPETAHGYAVITSVVTNADGMFELDTREQDPCLLLAVSEDHEPTAIRVAPTLRLSEPSFRMILPTGNAITGTIRDQGNDKPGVSVQLQSSGGATPVQLSRLRDRIIAFENDTPLVQWQTTECDPKGAFGFSGLSRRPYVVESVISGTGGCSFGLLPNDVVATPPAHGLVIGDTGSRIRFTVTCVGEPLQDADVEILDEGVPRVVCRTDHKGVTVCLLPAERDWSVRIRHEDISPKLVPVHSPSIGEQLSIGVETSKLSRNSSLALQIRYGGTGEPLQNARIEIAVADESGQELATKTLLLRSSDGRCIADGLPAGMARISVDPNGAWNNFCGMVCTETRLIPLARDERRGIDILMRPGGMIRTRVTSTSGAAISARIELLDAKSQRIPTSAFVEGQARPHFYADTPPASPFLLLPVLEKGDYDLSLTLFAGGASQSKRVTITEGSFTDVVFSFP